MWEGVYVTGGEAAHGWWVFMPSGTAEARGALVEAFLAWGVSIWRSVVLRCCVAVVSVVMDCGTRHVQGEWVRLDGSMERWITYLHFSRKSLLCLESGATREYVWHARRG